VVLLGDLNVVSRSHSPRYSAFRSWEYEAFDELKLTGFVDAHTSLYPDVQVHSWIGRKGAGYRYDYAFVSAALSGDVIGSEYLHEPRLHGLTDHAAVALTLADRLAPVGRIGPSDRSLVRSY
jgi:exodeoxyribonuclease-3